jgi:hypothetical protein
MNRVSTRGMIKGIYLYPHSPFPITDYSQSTGDTHSFA